ncbi:hypothetical protein GCM10025854_07180 [Tetragenococcus muriaticus]|nr:hypothetical protein GCM10025854_07180 [Tetragenococcus muriaticus]
MFTFTPDKSGKNTKLFYPKRGVKGAIVIRMKDLMNVNSFKCYKMLTNNIDLKRQTILVSV